ncbi:MAG TPA: exopolysaccharide biosynthesis protein [Roseovarius sp.]|nr:exopolysaccharide biosynthesis protein [Roseovarius sp.]
MRNARDSRRKASFGAIEVIDSAERALDGESSSLGEVIDAIGYASYTPLLMVPALALVSPLSGVPGFTTVCGILIASVSAQMMLRRPTLWLPAWLRRRSMSSQRACKVVNWFRIPARWLDDVTRQRFSMLVTTPFSILPQAVCFFLGAIIPLLELVPFTSSILGGVIGVLAAGMFARDGLLVLVGMLLAALAVGGVATIL